MLVRFDHVASGIVHANHSIVRLLCVRMKSCRRFWNLERPFIASLNADNLSPKCHWTALRRHWHRVVSLVWRIANGRADAFVVTVVSARTASENVHQCDAGKR